MQSEAVQAEQPDVVRQQADIVIEAGSPLAAVPALANTIIGAVVDSANCNLAPARANRGGPRWIDYHHNR